MQQYYLTNEEGQYYFINTDGKLQSTGVPTALSEAPQLTELTDKDKERYNDAPTRYHFTGTGGKILQHLFNNGTVETFCALSVSEEQSKEIKQVGRLRFSSILVKPAEYATIVVGQHLPA